MDVNKFWAQSENKTWSAMREYHCRKVSGDYLGTFEDYIYMLKDLNPSPPKLEVGDLVAYDTDHDEVLYMDGANCDPEDYSTSGISEVWREVEPSFYFTELELSNSTGAGSMMFGKDEIKIFKRIYKRADKSAGGE